MLPSKMKKKEKEKERKKFFDVISSGAKKNFFFFNIHKFTSFSLSLIFCVIFCHETLKYVK